MVLNQRDPDLTLHRRTIDAMHNVLRVLNSNRSLDEILEHIIRQPQQLLECDAAAIYLLDKDQRFYIQASTELDASLTQFNDAVNRSFAEQLTAAGDASVVTDCERLLKTEWVQQDRSRIDYVQNLVRHYRAYVAVPIIVSDEMRGALMVYYQQPRDFSADEVSLVKAFRDQAALALENTWLHEQVRQMAVAAERDRIARDLHDSVTQALYGIALCTEAALRHLSGGDGTAAAENLHQMRDLAQEALHEMRALIYQLHSPYLAGMKLFEAVQTRIRVLEVQSHLRIDLEVVPDLDIPSEMSEALYRIIQEALNNVLKHSNARNVVIALNHIDGCLTLSIKDNGIGFDPYTGGRGFGLNHMTERAHALGGCFTLHTTPGEGTTVYIQVPL